MTKLKGIDISSWQGTIDFRKVKESGIQFLILRSGFSRTVDKQFHNYVNGAREADIPVYGVYHFSYALNTDQAKKEADFCVEQVKKAGLGEDVVIFFDLEYDSVSYAKKHGVTIDKKACTAFTKAFCEEIEALGYRAGIYANLDYYRNMYDHGLLSKYVFWLADWSGDPDYSCDVHQYTSKGSVPGISGNVDMDYCYVEQEEIPMDEETIEKLAQEVLSGKWGNGQERKNALKSAGYDYIKVQARVNEMIYGVSTPNSKSEVLASGVAKGFDERLAGVYTVTASGGLQCRDSAGINNKALCLIPNGTRVNCYGYYTMVGDTKWLYIKFNLSNGVTYIGFASSEYLSKR